MFFETKRWSAPSALLILFVFFLAGCVSTPDEPKPAKQTEPPQERRIIVRDQVQEFRTQAVSRRVGRWAVVVGISDYQYDTSWNPQKGIPDLKYANKDARAFADFLISPSGGAFSPDHVRVLLDKQATMSEVRVAIGDFLARSLEDDLVVLFFAGHGTPDPKNPKNLYLLCHDTQPGKYYGTALPMWEIDVALTRTIRSKKVFVIADACHSAGVGGTRAVSVSDQFNEYMDAIARSRSGITKITASRANELSQEREFSDGGHGVFTHYLLKGLKGEADDNRDGFVTMKEAYGYLYDRVRSDTRHSQNPWASAYVSADIPLGIVDTEVLDAIKARIDISERPITPIQPVYTPPPPSTVSFDVPKDSVIAIKVARAKLAKGEIGKASEIVDAVLKRADASEPDALLMKIELLLKGNDLKSAEDAEDRLVIPYPDHPSAVKGARLVYRYYLAQVEDASKADKIRKLDEYVKRHPAGLLEKEAKEEINEIRASIRVGYERRYEKSLVLAQGFIRQNRFEQARKELNTASELSREAYSKYGIALDTSSIGSIKELADKEEVRYRTQWFENYLSKARSRFVAGDYTNAYGELEQAKKWATTEQMDSINKLASRYNAPPKVEIVMDKDVVDWETPIRFKYRATDTEGDPVRVVSWGFGDRTTSTQETPEHTFSKWEGAEKQKPFAVILKVTDGHSTVTAKKTIYVIKIEGIRDSHFIGFPNGVVRDTKTGLEWMAGPDKDTTWNEAKQWVESHNVAGGGWRMPTIDELETLYENGKGSRNMTPLLKTTGWWVWSGETKDSSSARSFVFGYGGRFLDFRGTSTNGRAFAVRSRR